MKTYVYIDGANLHQGSKTRGGVDYKKFKRWLDDKYKPERTFLFLGYIKGKEPLYTYLSTLGFITVFKETLEFEGKVKGNCDAELVLGAISNFYEEQTQGAVLVTGDGDFACVIDFYKKKQHRIIVLAPNKKFCSFLLKKRNIPLVFLEEVKSYFTKNPQ